MPTIAQSELPKPKSWEEFEDIALDLYKRIWDDPSADRHGRSGQPQHGIDIYGQPQDLDGRYAGIQCKRYTEGSLTPQRIKAEITKAEGFWAPLAEFIIATTEPRDAKLQEIVYQIDEERRIAGKFRLHIMFWETLCSHLADPANNDLLKKHYGDWLARGLAPRTDVPYQPPRPLPDVDCPYRGLNPFEAQHAEFYFGREVMVEQLVARVKDRNFVAVVGSSGCGKSSLVRAGLVTALRDGALPGSEHWVVRIFRPGNDPLHALASSFMALLEPEASEVDRLTEGRKLAHALRNETVLMADVVARVQEKHPDVPRLVLIADQFEELYTECQDEELCETFIATLLAAADEETITVVLTLRADFFGDVLADRRLGEAVDSGQVSMLPMNKAELRAAIERPALKTRRAFEPGLVDRILADVRGEPGSLPLLEFALTELWTRQTREGLLTHEAYGEIDGVAGAIAKRAEAAYEELAKQGRGEIAQRIFVRLTHYRDGAEGTRRRATIDDLVTPHTPQREVVRVVKVLTDARLLVTGHDQATGDATVQVSHEALIQDWSRLRRWLDENRAFGLWREKLSQALQTWHETEDEGALLRGAPLAEAEGWLNARQSDLNQEEQVFIKRGLTLRHREQSAKERQGQRITIAALAVAAIFMILTVMAGLLWQRSEERGQIALSRQLAAQSARELDASSPEIALLLATESGRAASTTEAYFALYQILAEPGRALAILPGHQFRWNADKNRVLTTIDEGAVKVLDAETGEDPFSLSRHSATRNANGSRIPTTEDDSKVQVWNAGTGEGLFILSGSKGWWNADGSRIMTTGKDSKVRVWSAETGKKLLTLSGSEAWWNADESRIMSTGKDGKVRVWDAETGEELFTLLANKEWFYTEKIKARWNTDGSRILTVSSERAVVWDAETGEKLLALAGRPGWVSKVKWNADESRILMIGDDNTARIWDAETGEELFPLSGHTDEIIQVQWNAGDTRILTSSRDGTVRVWNAQTGEELLNLSSQEEPHHDQHRISPSAIWNSNGSRILTDDDLDGPTRMWNAETGEELFTLLGLFRAWNPDENRILTASYDGAVAWVWDAETGEELFALSGHRGSITQARWNADESQILTASADHTVRVWDAKTGNELFTLAGHTDSVEQAEWNADESRVLTASRDGTVRVWDAEMGSRLPVLPGQAATWNSDESRILVINAIDGSTRVWDVRTEEELFTLSGLGGWNTDESCILTIGGWDGPTKVYDAETGKELLTLLGFGMWGNADESRILTGSENGTVWVWDAETGEELLTLFGHTDRIWDAEWNADESRILTASRDGTVRVWDTDTEECLLSLSSDPGGVNQADWNADETRILTAGSFGLVQVWDAETGTELLTLSGGFLVDWNSNESCILTTSASGKVRVWNAETGEELLAIPGSEAKWNADETRILTTSDDGTVRLWDAKTGKNMLTMSGHAGPINVADWNADESRILTASDDGTVRIWDAGTGENLLTLSGHTGSVVMAVWSADERRILTGGNDGTVRLWYTNMEDLLAQACRQAPRNLSQDEWQRFMGSQPYRETCPGKPVPGRDF